jgi:hypothetical protein
MKTPQTTGGISPLAEKISLTNRGDSGTLEVQISIRKFIKSGNFCSSINHQWHREILARRGGYAAGTFENSLPILSLPVESENWRFLAIQSRGFDPAPPELVKRFLMLLPFVQAAWETIGGGVGGLVLVHPSRAASLRVNLAETTGIGLGAISTGCHCVAFCDTDIFARKVLAKEFNMEGRL